MRRWQVEKPAESWPASGDPMSNTAYGYTHHGFKSRFISTVLFFAFVIVAVYAGYRIDDGVTIHANASRAATKKAVKKQVTVAPNPVPTPVAVDPLASLPSDMNVAINSQTGLSASATLIDLNTGKEYDAGNYTQTYEAASTSKLVAIFDYIHQVELGNASLSQTIQGDQAQDVIMRMIEYSDNNAWDALNGYLKFDGEQAYLNSIGVDGDMTPGNIQFSTPAMAKMLQLLYVGALMNQTNQAMIYNYMENTTMNALIPAALPQDATVYHKYGQVDGVLHDAAIVEYGEHHFVLVIYTNNPDNSADQYNAQVNLIHTITAVAFNDIVKN